MLISSSLPSSATWQTAPILSSSQPAPSVPSENGPAPTAQPANPAVQSSEHTASDRAQQKDATGAEASHPGVRRGQIKAQDAQSTDNSTASGQAAPGDTPPLAFQTVLNDVLPQVEEQNTQLTKQATDSPLSHDLAKVPADTALTAKVTTRNLALDPSFQIAKQGLDQGLADGEVAFAARIAQRAGTQATVDLRDPGTVIAASRFDASRPGASADADLQIATAAKKNDAAPLQANTPSDSTQQAAESQLSGNANSNGGSGGQGETYTPDGLRAASESQDAGVAMQPAQHTVTSMGAATPLAADSGSHSSGAAKTSAEASTPQLLEPQGDSVGRSGESVRSISLRLSNAEQGSVQVRLSERAGELQVSVRTPDAGLTRGLRDGLPDLMSRLQVNGYRAETWQPGGNGSSAGQDRGYDAPAHGNSQQRNSGGNQQQSSQQQQQQDEQTPQWVREMESSFQRSNSQWPASPAR